MVRSAAAGAYLWLPATAFLRRRSRIVIISRRIAKLLPFYIHGIAPFRFLSAQITITISRCAPTPMRSLLLQMTLIGGRRDRIFRPAPTQLLPLMSITNVTMRIHGVLPLRGGIALSLTRCAAGLASRPLTRIVQRTSTARPAFRRGC